MKLDRTNLYIMPKEKFYVVCIELPDHSRNYIHSQPMILGDCMAVMDDLLEFDIATSANDPYIMPDGTYYRLKMTITPKALTIDYDLYFESRKLNLNDAINERNMLLDQASG